MSEAACHHCHHTSALHWTGTDFECRDQARCQQNQRTNKIHDAYMRELEADLER